MCQVQTDENKIGILSDAKPKMKQLFSSIAQMRENCQDVAVALALHNINRNHSETFKDNLYTKGVYIDDFCISLSTEPLAYLLRVCDELQCWDRHYLSNPLDKIPYLKGAQVQLAERDNHTVIQVNDDATNEKIKNALNGIISPPISEWLL